MPPYVRNFRGKMDLDNDPYRVGEQDYIDAYNITRDSRDNGQDKVVANIVGNTLYDYTLPSGVNKVIGSKEDLIRGRMYFFIWNSNDYHSILYYNAAKSIVTKLLINKTDCYLNQDILQFNPSYKINHIDIIYRNEGDLIYFTDGKSRPKCLDTYYITFNTNIRITDIEMAKQPPLVKPFCWYEDDNSVLVNNLRKSLFKIKLRYVYDDLTKSTTSTQGALALPISENVLIDPPSKNAKLSIAFTTGERNVKKIEILAANNNGNIFSDYYLIKSIDKTELGLGDNEVAIYNFYNNEAYNNIEVKESIQLFDYIPNKAFVQSSANGNTIEYANLLEGYDNPSTGLSEVYSNDYVLYQAYQTGNIYAYQNGDSTNVLSNFTITIIALGTNFNRYTQTNINTTNDLITYTNTSANQSLTDYLNGIEAAAISLGYSTSRPQINTLLITKTNEYLINFDIFSANVEYTIDTFKASIPCYDWWTRYSFGLVFFDDKGKTNGVVFPINNTIQSGGYVLENLSTYSAPRLMKVLFEINQTVPEWAYGYQIVRSSRLNKDYFIQWVSDLTLKETIGGALDQQYAYISINSLDAFINENPSSSYLAYSFSTKDRIRFIANGMQPNGTATHIYTDKDFEILDYVANPTVNGKTYVGKYIKILLPPTDSNFDFGTMAFYNYFVEVYKPTVPVSNGLNLYYEFGLIEKTSPFEVINKNIPSFLGDCYGRFRTINTSPRLKWTKNDIILYDVTNSGGVSVKSVTLALDKAATNYDYGLLTSFNEAQSFATPPIERILEFINDGLAHTFTLNLSFDLQVHAYFNYVNGFFHIVFYDDTNTVIGDTTLINLPTPTSGKYSYSGTVTSPIGTVKAVMWFRAYFLPLDDNYITFYLSNTFLSIVETSSTIKQFCIDPNFSDYYSSAVNSNGRAYIHDVNAKQQWFPTTIRFSKEYQQNTNINQTNRFYSDNLDEYDRAAGDIKKLFVDGRRLYVMQMFNIGVVPILQQIISDTSGNPLQAQSDILLNKIQYPFQGKIGIGNVPESFAYHNKSLYGIDNNRGVAWRLSLAGFTEISVVYECDAFFTAQCDAYADTLNNGHPAAGQQYLGNPTIYGTFDNYTNKVIWAFEEINRYSADGDLIFHQDPKTLIFNEAEDDSEGFECFTNYYAESLNCLGTELVSFKNGKIWVHNNTTQYCNFYGQQYDAYIKVVFNGNPYEKKNFLTLSQLGSIIWECPEITTQVNSYGNTKQLSSLITQDFLPLEGTNEAYFLRDSNSIGGLLAGDNLYGHYIIIEFRKTNASNFVSLAMAVVNTNNSYLTTK